MPARKAKNRVRAVKTPRRTSQKKPARRRTARQPLVGFIGAGNMARSLAGGLLKNGWARNRLILADPDSAQRSAVEKVLKLKTYATNNDVAARADILVLAVKPQVLRAAALELTQAVQRRRPLVISVAAGVRLADLERWLGGGLPVVRVMPNTAALIGSGAAGLYANPRVAPEQRNQAESILRSVGVTVWLADESLLDVVTAVSGSGPAYFFRVMEALERAAIAGGLDAATARLLTLETAFGAAKMALEGGEEPAVLRARVTSPGGTTEQALGVLESGGIETLFHQAVRAATRRARELAEMFGKGA
ncbi:pyrroline-5-carboxylate reductase [Sulfurifustis variabilis]|uniref:Pyrroline-5-carboxylate reductase n=1 Tax=Sulfurifustis variabilis TaxID=1675686 RepID=A0A1C7AFH5_9GAMM|nr:pyrroline-5-carboxylate reductase [Sulfurifustis variabilis]BAU50076.1 pyrroline-5-carboxylate reductase [Sulfurifustis variabilis]